MLDLVTLLNTAWLRQVRFGEMRAGLTLALEAAQAMGDQAALAWTRLRLGEIALEQSDLAAAEFYLAAAAARYQRLEETVGIAESLCFLGRVEGKLGDYAVAEAHLIEAATAAAALNDLGRLAEVQFDRIVLCRRRGQIGEGLAIGYDCLERFKRSGRVRWEAPVMGQLAILHRLNGEPGQALPLLLESARVFDEQGDPYEQARAWDQLAEVYAAMGDAACSARAREKVLALNAALDEPPTRFGKVGDQ